MRANLKNTEELSSGNIKLGETKLQAFLASRELDESLTDTGIPSQFKEITDISNIVWGHFVIIEKILSYEGLEYIQKMKHLMPFLIRPVNEKALDNSDEEKEKKHIDAVHSIDMGALNAAFERFYKVREDYLFKRFNGVIYSTKSDADEDEEEEPKLDGAVSARQFHNKKFFWDEMTMRLVGGDIMREQEAVDLPMFSAMKFFARERSKQIVEELEYKANRK